MRIIYLTFISLLLTDAIYSQVPRLVPETDTFYGGSKYKFDQRYGAAILKETNEVYLHPDQSSGISILTDRKVQKIIYNKEGFKYANIEFGYKVQDSLVDFKAQVLYRGESEGFKVFTTTYTKKDLICNLENDSIRTCLLDVKDVPSGSTIVYGIRFKNNTEWRIDPWYINKTLPVRENILTLTLPEVIPINIIKNTDGITNIKETSESLKKQQEFSLLNDFTSDVSIQEHMVDMKKIEFSASNIKVGSNPKYIKIEIPPQKTPYLWNVLTKSFYEYGAINIDLLSQNHYHKDSSVAAYYIFDRGKTHRDGKYERHIRLKILNKDGYKWANFITPLFNTIERNKIQIEGNTYNLVNDQIEITPLPEESVFDDELVDKYYTRKRISFPQVREGSIVELK